MNEKGGGLAALFIVALFDRRFIAGDQGPV
jgi:hypothetical protein